MLYQASGYGLFILFSLDLVIIALLYFLDHFSWRLGRILLYGFALLLVFFSASFKLLFSGPAHLGSTPAELSVENRLANSFQTFYYLSEDKDGQPHVFWKEYMLGRHKTQILETEGFYGLLLAKKIQRQWQYQRIQPTRLVAVLDEAHFKPDTSGRIAKAVRAYAWVEAGIYASEILTLAVLLLLVYRLPALRKRITTVTAAISPTLSALAALSL